jgi:26S proteasome regulatory subunit N11
LQNLHKKKWTDGLSLPRFDEAKKATTSTLESMASFTESYAKRVAEEETSTPEAVALAHVGQVDPKKRLEADVAALLSKNIVLSSATHIDSLVF